MKKINKITKEITNAKLPKSLKGLKQESLNDLSWTDESLGLQDFAFWKEKNITEAFDSATHKLDGNETYTLDEDNFLVNVSQKVVEKTAEELEAEFKDTVPASLTMRQTRLALLGANLLETIETAIKNGTDEAMKIEWEYADVVRRDWDSLNAMASGLGMSERQLDNLFIAGGEL